MRLKELEAAPATARETRAFRELKDAALRRSAVNGNVGASDALRQQSAQLVEAEAERDRVMARLARVLAEAGAFSPPVKHSSVKVLPRPPLSPEEALPTPPHPTIQAAATSLT